MTEPPHPCAFSVHALACQRADRLLFRDLSFALDPTQALILCGPNGSGKSSLLRILAGLSLAALGRICWYGQDVARDLEAQRARIVYLGHQDAIKPGLSIREHLSWFAYLGTERLSSAILARRLDYALERLEIAALADLPGRVLSAGQRRRLALARLLARPVPLWLLDEPTNALDARAVEIFQALAVEHLQAGGMIVAATHLDLGFSNAKTVTISAFAPAQGRQG